MSSPSTAQSIWIVRALAVMDLLMQSVGLVIRAAYIPTRYVSYPFYQLVIAGALLMTSVVGLLVTIFALDKPIALRLYGSFMAGNICANTLALLILVVSLIFHGLWYRMCDNPKVCPLVIDMGAVMLAFFVGTQLAWSLFGQSILALKTKRLANIAQRLTQAATTQNAASETTAIGSTSQEPFALKTPLSLVGATVQEKSGKDPTTPMESESAPLDNREIAAVLAI